jgi:signal transduction histidine kinase
VVVFAAVAAFAYCLDQVWSASTGRIVSDHLMTAVPLVAGVASLVLASRRHSQYRLAWLLLAGWGILAAAGNVVWEYNDLIAHIAPFPSPADIGYLGGSLCMVGSVIAFMATMPGASRVRPLLDGALISGSVFIVSWTFVLHRVYNASTGTALLRIVGLAYPVLDVVFVSLIVFAVSQVGGSARTPLMLIGIGIFGWVISDTAFAYFTAVGTYQAGTAMDAGWIGGHAVIALAAFQALFMPAARPDLAKREPPRMRILLPYILAGFALVVASFKQIDQGRIDPLSIILTMVLLIVVVVRQFVAVLETKTATIGRLRSVDEMKNQILRAVSHELRTPLTVIKGTVELLSYDDDNLTAAQRNLVGRLDRNADRLEEYLSSLLDLERLTRGVIEPARTRTDLVALEERIAGVVNRDQHEVRVDDGEVWANVDPAQVERIVENLMINATRHTPAGTTIFASARRVEGGVLLTVADNGPGIPDGKKKDIFDPFVQLADPLNGGRGSGIGLALVAKFAELHEGRAWVEDNDGGGACFRVLLSDDEGVEALEPPADVASRPSDELLPRHEAA